MAGAIAALRAVRQPSEVVLIVNEETSITRSALREGFLSAVNVNPLDELSQPVVNKMINTVRDGLSPHPRQSFIEQRYLLPEMI